MGLNYCQNCPCVSCSLQRAAGPKQELEQASPIRFNAGKRCAFDAVAEEYKRRGVQMPTSLLLHCDCERCVKFTC